MRDALLILFCSHVAIACCFLVHRYFPRGTIHQAVTSEKLSSIHVTLSTYQKFAWVDFLQVAASTAIENAAKQVAQLRAGLPLNFLSKFGAGGVATAAEKVPGSSAFARRSLTSWLLCLAGWLDRNRAEVA